LGLKKGFKRFEIGFFEFETRFHLGFEIGFLVGGGVGAWSEIGFWEVFKR
jgi:hypothetical protein